MLERFPLLQSLCKWLIITIVVIAGFITVLLGLGYLLHENEQETRQFKEQLDAKSLKKSSSKGSIDGAVIELTPMEDINNPQASKQSKNQPNPQ